MALAGLVDGTVRVLDMRNTQRAAATWKCCQRPIHSLAVVPRPSRCDRAGRVPQPQASLVFAASILGVYAAVWVAPSSRGARGSSAEQRASMRGQPGQFIRVWTPPAGCTLTGVRLSSSSGALVASCRGCTSHASGVAAPAPATHAVLAIPDLCRVYDAGLPQRAGSAGRPAAATAQCPAEYVSGHSSSCLALRGASLLRCSSRPRFSAGGTESVVDAARVLACAHDATRSVGYWVLDDTAGPQAGRRLSSPAAPSSDVPVAAPVPCMRTVQPAHPDFVVDVVDVAVGRGRGGACHASATSAGTSGAPGQVQPADGVEEACVRHLVVSVSKSTLMVHRVVHVAAVEGASAC